MADEKRFENKIKRFLQSEGIYALGTAADRMDHSPCGYYEKRWGSKFSKSGLPDISISIMTHSLEVEIKAENGKPSELQKVMIRQMQSAGTAALVLYPDDFEEFKTLIQYIKNGCYNDIPKRFTTLLGRGLNKE